MSGFVSRHDLSVAEPIAEFAESALAEAAIEADTFWRSVSEIVHEFGPRNAQLLQIRDELQEKIDGYHRERPGVPDAADYRAFLTDIGYLVAEPEPFAITTTGVDPEIATMAGPQLVVPLLNARFALNAANARWGSLYDALYGTDAIDVTGALAPGARYNPERGAAVIAKGRALLDSVAPLDRGSHSDAIAYVVDAGVLSVQFIDGAARLSSPEAFVGYTGDPQSPRTVLLAHNGLHLEIIFDRDGGIGSTDDAGVQDIVLESALTTIVDLEDSVAAVDAEDKALGYRNWRGLMDGTLTETVVKGDHSFVRELAPDRQYTTPDGGTITLPGRSVLFIRNVGHLMRTDAIRDRNDEDIYEGILDTIMTVLGALSDLRGPRAGANSRAGSVYIVKPKMHGPDEVAFASALFERTELLFQLPRNTIKMGIMDEERRTSANLAACIRAASDRVVFINTGFLDRTGDEIHTSLHAGVMLPKSAIRTEPFMQIYEARNVAIGVASGLDGKAQIGKGMWAMPDLMHAMLEQKISHVSSGASTAWVPSPTAATLHALHYHQLDAFAERHSLAPLGSESLGVLLQIPLAGEGALVPAIVDTEVDNNVQSILGYVVRWIDQGVGCSKVPDIHGTALMEDRATLRISSQLLANWLAHGVIDEKKVDASLRRLAAVVDEQNSADPAYEPLILNGVPGIAYTAARRLIVEGGAQPNGYTEPLLHTLRREKKAESLAAIAQ